MKATLTTIDDAAALIGNGAVVGIGGIMFLNKPMAMIRAIIRRRPSDLTLIPAAPSTIDIDQLVGSGCVARVFVQAVTGGATAPVGPRFRSAAQSGSVEVIDLDQGMINAGLRAARFGLGSLPTLSGLGSDHAAAAPEWLRLGSDPFTGAPTLAVRALRPDVAIVHAAQSDELGHAVQVGGGFNDELLCSAARSIIVTAEEIVPTSVIKAAAARTFTWAHKVSAVVAAPGGAAPLASDGSYIEDAEAVNEYLELARSDDGFAQYLIQRIDAASAREVGERTVAR